MRACRDVNSYITEYLAQPATETITRVAIQPFIRAIGRYWASQAPTSNWFARSPTRNCPSGWPARVVPGGRWSISGPSVRERKVAGRTPSRRSRHPAGFPRAQPAPSSRREPEASPVPAHHQHQELGAGTQIPASSVSGKVSRTFHIRPAAIAAIVGRRQSPVLPVPADSPPASRISRVRLRADRSIRPDAIVHGLRSSVSSAPVWQGKARCHRSAIYETQRLFSPIVPDVSLRGSKTGSPRSADRRPPHRRP